MSRRFWHVLGQWILSTIPTVEAGPPRPGVGVRPFVVHYSKSHLPAPVLGVGGDQAPLLPALLDCTIGGARWWWS